MKTIQVAASGRYDVKIGAGLLETLGVECAKVCTAEKAAIISDTHV